MMLSVERHMDPLKLFILLIAVTLTKCSTTPPVVDMADNATEVPSMLTDTTELPETFLNSTFEPNATVTDFPNIVTGDLFFPDTSDSSLPSFPNITTETPPTMQMDTFTTTGTLPPLFDDSTATSDNITATQPPLGPDATIGNTNPDPQGPLTTPSPVPSTTSIVTPRTTSPQIAPQYTPSPFPGVQINPYSNQLHRPRPLSPLTQQQQQRMLNPWLFAGSDYFPYMFLMSQQQSNPQNLPNPATNNLAPLYLTAMDFELWPWLLTQQRSQQQQLTSQQQPGRSQPQPLQQPRSQPLQQPRSQPQSLQQPSRQIFPNQNPFPQSQTFIPQQSQTRNNLANLYWLNEIYF